MFGEIGQNAIEAQKIAIVGAGGLGSQIAQAVAYTGVRNIGIIDDDRLDETNLNREAGGFPSDVGRLKVDVVKEHILKINPHANVLAIPLNLRTRDAMDFLIGSTSIFGCVDHDGPRLVLSELAAAYNIPLIDSATEIFSQTKERQFDFGGRVVVARPGDFCLFCANEIDVELAKQELEPVEIQTVRKKHGYGLGNELPSPAVFALNGVIASLAVTEFLLMATGIRQPFRMQRYKGMRGVVTVNTDERKRDCFTCGFLRGQRDKANIWRYLLPPQRKNSLAA